MIPNDTSPSPAAPTEAARGVSLRRAASILKVVLGDKAPARITLQRHSESGSLDKFVIGPAGKRKLYDWNAMADHYRRVEPSGPIAATEAPPIASQPSQEAPAPAPALNEQALERVIAKILQPFLQPLTEKLGELTRQVSGLASIRSSLMLKYDAAASLTNQRLDQVVAENVELKRSRDLEQQVAKLRADVGRLIQTVESIKNND